MNEYIGNATYSPEDDKIRIYPFARLDPETYARVKAAGYIWAPKQELFVGYWGIGREDIALELCGEIGDEDKSLVERSEERAERMETYAEHRQADADRAQSAVAAIADGIPLGQPILIGHHSERHARRDAKKIENGMRRAVKMWEQAEYWQSRASGAIRLAKYKERPDVRARRIKKLEAELRKCEKDTRNSIQLPLDFWSGNLKRKSGGFFEVNAKTAIWFCNVFDDHGVKLSDGTDYYSAWSALTDGRATVEEIRAQRLTELPKALPNRARYVEHLKNRIAYEKAMLGEVGGIVADKVKPEVGGGCKCWVGMGKWCEIVKVNKVTVSVADNWGNGGPDFLRAVPFDKLKAVVSKADFDAMKSGDKPDPAPHQQPKHEPNGGESGQDGESFRAMREALRMGAVVQIVVADNLFPTPPEVAAKMVKLANITGAHRVLEPSAGTGNILKALNAHNGPSLSLFDKHIIEAVEINANLAQVLSDKGLADTVTCADFLTCNGNLGKFDRVVMNPPFDHGSDIEHIKHAMHFLRPGGILVALCANGPKQVEQLKPLSSRWEELPMDTFRSQGTTVRAALLVIQNPT